MAKHPDPRASYIAIASRKFATDGFHGASLAALAKDAGVTKQALLHFFGTKERLYAEVLAELAGRQCAEIGAVALPDPAQHLKAYFETLRAKSVSQPDDAKLVIRALLDSDPNARTWPMKPYLDRLVALVRSTAGGASMSDEEALAWVFQMIGAIQYFVISGPAIAGMYGKAEAKAVMASFEILTANAVQKLLTG